MLGFIVNPVAGNGRGGKVWPEIESRLREKTRPFHVRFTERAGDARKLAREMAEQNSYKAVVAVGGDGTVNEVVHGLYLASCPCGFGYIPAGSGNDFARGHHLPLGHMEALDWILSDPAPQPIDLFLADGRIAVNSLGAGFDGKVAQVTNSAGYKKWLNRLRLGFLAYVITVVRVLLSYKPAEVEVLIDGMAYRYPRVWLVAITNIPYIGGGMKICPRAAPDDGLAEVCIVHNISRLEILRVFPLVYAGKHVHHRAVSFQRGKQIAVHSADFPLAVHADGEFADSTPLAVSVVPKAIHILKKSAGE